MYTKHTETYRAPLRIASNRCCFLADCTVNSHCFDSAEEGILSQPVETLERSPRFEPSIQASGRGQLAMGKGGFLICIGPVRR